MILLADSGSTKTEWVLKERGDEKLRVITSGINPIQMSEGDVKAIVTTFARENPLTLHAEGIEFYGSGCTPRGSEIMRSILQETFSNAKTINVGSDIIGAARALLGKTKGIACILGTGANSCLWDGEKVVQQTPCLGYILGDEGGGAVLGRSLVNLLYKGGAVEKNVDGTANVLFTLRQEFERTYTLTMADVIERVYRCPNPNRWLASLSPFIASHLDVPQMKTMVIENFRRFFNHNIVPYAHPEMPVHFVGSIAWHYRDLLAEAASAEGFTLGKIIQKPL